MTDTCVHGFTRDGCLICRTLAAGESATTRVVEQRPQRRDRVAPDRPEVLDTRPDAGVRHHRSLTGSLVLVLAAALAAGAAAWILVGLVFTVLHVLELIVVGLGCGWVGYKIGHFRGSRQPRART